MGRRPDDPFSSIMTTLGTAWRAAGAKAGPALRAVGRALAAGARMAGRGAVAVVRAIVKGLRAAVRVAGPALGKAGSAIAAVAGRGWSAVRGAMRPDAAPSKRTFRIRRALVFGCAAVLVVVLVVVGCAIGGVFGRGGTTGGTGGASTSSSSKGIGKTGKTAGAADGAKSDKKPEDRSADTSKSAAQSGAKAGKTGKPDADNDASALDKAAGTLTDAKRAVILKKAEEAAAASGKARVDLTYCVATKGKVGDLDTFATQAYEALNDTRGWPRAGVTFTQGDAADGNCDFTLILSEARYLPEYDAGCSAEYSCRVGDDVIINWDRWRTGTAGWLKAGGTLRRYREMAVNHEVGHRLGHIDNETPCAGDGKPAALMQQQSKGLNGCTPNEWPLDSELWTQ
ncbi:DUF3152 domain-containing protein [Bifidobacterium platyrrhinorum]|nr:DUF3152 domain-containing protein [Bifidobacterium platyrrhinorum]